MSRPFTLFITARPKNDGLYAVFQRYLNHVKGGEPGTITFRMFQQDDNTLRFYEDYISSEAYLQHMAGLEAEGLLDDWNEVCDVQETIVLGNPTSEAQAVLDKVGVVYAAHKAGFSRLRLVP